MTEESISANDTREERCAPPAPSVSPGDLQPQRGRSPREEAAFEGEVNVGEILRVLYSRKWILLAISLLAGLVTAAIEMTMPNVYESSAALIVRQPKSLVPGEVTETLTLEALQSLTESTEIKRKLFDKLWKDQALQTWKDGASDEQTEFRLFQDCLSTTINKEESRGTGGAVGVVPVLLLDARAQSPDEAATIANEWATIVEARSREFYSEGVKSVDALVSNMYKQSNEALIKAEDELAMKTLQANLEMKKARAKTLLETAVSLDKDILTFDYELRTNEVIIAEGKRRTAEQQHEGEWIGTVAQKTFREKAALLDEEKLSPQARQVLNLVQQQVEQEDLLRTYKEQQNPLSKKSKLEWSLKNIDRTLQEKAIADDQLPAVHASLEDLSNQIKAIPEKVTLDKAITDDALWSAYIDKKLTGKEGIVPLKSEILNPVFQTTQGSIVELTAEVEKLKSSSKQLASSADAAISSVSDLETEIDHIQKEVDRQEKELEATKDMLEGARNDYLLEMAEVATLERGDIRRREELQVKKSLFTKSEEEVRRLEEDILKSENEIQAMNREIEKTKGVQTALASQAEAAALLLVSTEQASRTGTAILFNAEANPLKVSPKRSLLCLAAMLVAFIVSSVIVYAATLIQQGPDGRDRNGTQSARA